MSESTWIRTITRPVSHLVGTIVVMANVLVCGVIASTQPQWQPPLVLIGTIPLIVWFTLMAWKFERAKGASPEQAERS